MDDISEKLSALLNNPEGLEGLKSMAESLLNGEGTKEKDQNSLQQSEIAGIMKILNALKSTNDKSVDLLLALKPHLSHEKQAKLDTAIKLLKIYSILPLLKDTNILGDLF